MVPRCHTHALDDAVGDRRRGGLPAQARPVMMRRSCMPHAKLDGNQLTQRVSSRIRYAEMTRLLTTDPNAASAMQPTHGDGMINGRQGRQPCTRPSCVCAAGTGGRVERKRKGCGRERSRQARRAADTPRRGSVSSEPDSRFRVKRQV
jgi:hypothetical protein